MPFAVIAIAFIILDCEQILIQS